MKRRRSASDGQPGPPLQPTMSPWRWNIGGPILDFGDEAEDAGPSTAPCACHDCVAPPSSSYRASSPSTSTSTLLRRRRRASRSDADADAISGADSDDDHESLSSSLNLSSVAATSRRRLRKERDRFSRPWSVARHLTTALAFSIASAPLAAAGPVPLPSRSTTLTAATDTSSPPPTRTLQSSSTTTTPPPTPTRDPTQTEKFQRRRIDLPSLFEEPSLLPSATLATLSAEALPYVVTQSSDGKWYHDPRPWWLYGVVMVSPILRRKY